MARAIYADREEAGRELAEALKRSLKPDLHGGRPLVLAIPRGGVVLGREVAETLEADLDLVVPRKVGAEYQPEFALGAVMSDGSMYLDQDSIRLTGASSEYVESEKARQIAEAKRRVAEYRMGRDEPKIPGRVVVVVDDGVATGATMIVSLRSVRAKGARLVVAAAPVAPRTTLATLRREADRVVCPHTPEPFHAIGAFYARFDQVTDEEVEKALQEYWARPRA